MNSLFVLFRPPYSFACFAATARAPAFPRKREQRGKKNRPLYRQRSERTTDTIPSILLYNNGLPLPHDNSHLIDRLLSGRATEQAAAAAINVTEEQQRWEERLCPRSSPAPAAHASLPPPSACRRFVPAKAR